MRKESIRLVTERNTFTFCIYVTYVCVEKPHRDSLSCRMSGKTALQ